MEPRVVALDKLWASIETWERDYRIYSERTTEELPDGLKRNCLESMCPDDLRTHLDLNASSLDTYVKVKGCMESYIEARRQREPHGGAAPMEVDVITQKTGSDARKCNACGKPGHFWRECRNAVAKAAYERQMASKGYGKSGKASFQGKGKYGKSKSKGKRGKKKGG